MRCNSEVTVSSNRDKSLTMNISSDTKLVDDLSSLSKSQKKRFKNKIKQEKHILNTDTIELANGTVKPSIRIISVIFLSISQLQIVITVQIIVS